MLLIDSTSVFYHQRMQKHLSNNISSISLISDPVYYLSMQNAIYISERGCFNLFRIKVRSPLT